MPWLDLHEGILEEFSEAQGAWRARREDEQEGAFAEAKARRAERKREYMRGVPRAKKRQWRRTARANLVDAGRAARVEPPAWTPPAPPRELVTCRRCGSAVELRAGCSRPAAHPCRSLTRGLPRLDAG